MAKLLHVLAGVLLLAAVAVLVVLAAALQAEPAVALLQEPDQNDVARALALLRSHDPRRTTPGALSTLRVTERDLDVLLNHAAYRTLDATTRVTLERGAATVRASVHLPRNPFGRWLNLQARLVQTGGLPVLESLQVGRLPVPVWLGERAALHLAARSGLLEELQLAADVVRRVDFMPQQLGLLYAWRNDSAERMVAALLPPGEAERLRAYSDRLVVLAAREKTQWVVSLAPLLGPLFELARQRSAAGGNAAAENRAALLVLTLFANGRGVDALLPAARTWPRPRPLRLQLAGRDDFPLHWLVSATLAMEGTGPLSKAIGLYKEVADSRGGSGFSFNDMAANRAGTRLGELAMAQPERLQTVLARGVQESDILPAMTDLPEFMPEAEFVRRYGGVGAPAYTAMLAEIDRRIAALPALR
jgi:hypothetical protein